MGAGDKLIKKLYMRQFSHVFRKHQHSLLSVSSNDIRDVIEDAVVELVGLAKQLFRMICRTKQRTLQKYWNRWVKNADVEHDYIADVRTILLRLRGDDITRTELEIEVLFKWAMQFGSVDPTGLARSLMNCRSKKCIVNALQQVRLECFYSRDGIVYQGHLPKVEDGHFTVLRGECDIVQFQQNSISLLKLQDFTKRKKWDDVRSLLSFAQTLANVCAPAGFGELNTLTAVKRAATVKAGPDGCELLVLPKTNFLELQGAQRADGSKGGSVGLPSEAIDFLRQSGLAHKISASDLIAAAKSVVKRTLNRGEILFCKGEPVNSVFLIVSGEFVMDIGDVREGGKLQPFVNCSADHCFHLGAGSILGDEGILGQSGRFESTAVAISELAVCFEAVGFGLTFLAERLGSSRYCALAYKDLPRWTPALGFAEQANLYAHFHSLRRSIAYQRPFRGSKKKSYLDDSQTAAVKDFTSPVMMLHRPALADQLQDRLIAQAVEESTHSVSTTDSGGWGRPKIGLIQSRNRGHGHGSSHGSSNHHHHHHHAKRPHQNQQQALQNLHQQPNRPAAMFRTGSTASGPDDKAPIICESSVTTVTLDQGVVMRKLTPTALHHANELNKGAKKKFQDFFKICAQENILEHELHDHDSASNQLNSLTLANLRHTEGRLRSSMHGYRERISNRAEILLNLTKVDSQQMNAATLHNFITNTLSSIDDQSDFSSSTETHSASMKGKDQSFIAAAMSHIDLDLESVGESTTSGHSIDPLLLKQVIAASMSKALTKLDLYYMWLDRQLNGQLESPSGQSPSSRQSALIQNGPGSPAAFKSTKSGRGSPTKFDSTDEFDSIDKSPKGVGKSNSLKSKSAAGSPSPSMVQSFGVIPGIIPRGPREKVQLSMATPWRPVSPESKRDSPLAIPQRIASSSAGSPPGTAASQIRSRDSSPSSQRQHRNTSPMMGSRVIQKAIKTSLNGDVEEKPLPPGERFARVPAPTTRRMIQHALIVNSLERRIGEQVDVMLKKFEAEHVQEVNEISKFLADIEKLDFPVLKRHKPGEVWNTRYPTIRGSADNFNEMATSNRLQKALSKIGISCDVQDDDSQDKTKLTRRRRTQKKSIVIQGTSPRSDEDSGSEESEIPVDQEHKPNAAERRSSLRRDSISRARLSVETPHATGPSVNFSPKDNSSPLPVSSPLISPPPNGNSSHRNNGDLSARSGSVVGEANGIGLELSIPEVLDITYGVGNTSPDQAAAAAALASDGLDDATATSRKLHGADGSARNSPSPTSADQRGGDANATANTPGATPKLVGTPLNRAAQRVEPIERGMLATVNPRSSALDKYYELICAEKPSRSFLDGKRKCLKESKFKLSHAPILPQPERIDLHHLNILEWCIEKNLKGEKIEPKPWRQVDTTQFTETLMRQRNDEIQAKFNDILSRSYQPVPIAEAKAKAASDPDITAWTECTVKMSADYKNGPHMTFPVLLRAQTATGEKTKQSRTKRWGTGQMAAISAAAEDEPISGPPTYLEVYKSSTHTSKNASLSKRLTAQAGATKKLL